MKIKITNIFMNNVIKMFKNTHYINMASPEFQNFKQAVNRNKLVAPAGIGIDDMVSRLKEMDVEFVSSDTSKCR